MMPAKEGRSAVRSRSPAPATAMQGMCHRYTLTMTALRTPMSRSVRPERWASQPARSIRAKTPHWASASDAMATVGG